MAKVKCICKNYGECDLADSKETVEAEKTNLVCPECGKPLYPVEVVHVDPDPWKKRMIIGGIIAAVLVIVGVVLYFVMSGSSEVPVEKKCEECGLPLTECKGHEATPVCDKCGLPLTECKGHPVEKCDKCGLPLTECKGHPVEKCDKCGLPLTECKGHPVEKCDKCGLPLTECKGHPDPEMPLSYGKYSGDIKNGHPHGQGRLTYTKERVINKYDMKKRVAKPGDYVMGEFVNGYFINGKLYDANGNIKESLMIGVSANDDYDAK